MSNCLKRCPKCKSFMFIKSSAFGCAFYWACPNCDYDESKIKYTVSDGTDNAGVEVKND